MVLAGRFNKYGLNTIILWKTTNNCGLLYNKVYISFLIKNSYEDIL